VSRIKLIKTPEYKALMAFVGEELTQEELIDFLLDWSHLITFYDDNRELEPGRGIALVRKLTVTSISRSGSEQSEYRSNKSASELIEIQSGDEALPAFFAFESAPYRGFELMSFTCSLRAKVKHDQLLLRYRISILDTIKEDIANEFKDKITDNLDVNIYLGTCACYQR